MVLTTPSAGRQFIKLAGDFSNTTTEGGAGGDVTDFGFIPEPSTRYYVEGVFLVRSALTTVGPRPGIKWTAADILDEVAYLFGSPGDISSTVHHMEGALSATNQVLQLTSVVATAFSYPVMLRAWFETGPVVVGSFQIILFSETGGTSVTLKAGSFLAVYSGHVNQ
jgi:hypothetical protein